MKILLIPYKDLESQRTKELERDLIAVPRHNPIYPSIMKEWVESEKKDLEVCISAHPGYMPCQDQNDPYRYKLQEFKDEVELYGGVPSREE